MSIVAGKYEFTKQENGKDFYAGVGGKYTSNNYIHSD